MMPTNQDIDSVDDSPFRPYPPVPATVHQKVTAPIPTVGRGPIARWRIAATVLILTAAVPCGIAAADPVINGADLAVVALLIAFVLIFVVPGEDI